MVWNRGSGPPNLRSGEPVPPRGAYDFKPEDIKYSFFHSLWEDREGIHPHKIQMVGGTVPTNSDNVPNHSTMKQF